MDKGRLEAFSDGVIAIIITITILLIDLPDGNDWPDLLAILPLVLCYFISFVIIGTNWVNHHHLLQAADQVNGKILWANLLYLFFLSFIPVSTGWVGRSSFAPIPVRVYVFVNLLAAISYDILERLIVHGQSHTTLKDALLSSRKEAFSIAVETLAFILTFIPGLHIAACPLLLVAYAPWIIPDLRMKKAYEQKSTGKQ